MKLEGLIAQSCIKKHLGMTYAYNPSCGYISKFEASMRYMTRTQNKQLTTMVIPSILKEKANEYVFVLNACLVLSDCFKEGRHFFSVSRKIKTLVEGDILGFYTRNGVRRQS